MDHWQSVQCSYNDNFNGGNESTKPVVHEINGTKHIIPANCKFSKVDLQNIQKIDQADGYDMIVIDPPWWNKYVRRSRSFNRENG